MSAVDLSLAYCPTHPERTPIVVHDGRGWCARCALIRLRVNVPPELRAEASDVMERLRRDVAAAKREGWGSRGPRPSPTRVALGRADGSVYR